jgi:hypothetical protein
MALTTAINFAIGGFLINKLLTLLRIG